MNSYRHIDHSLEDQAEPDPDRKKSPEISLAFRCDPYHPEKKDAVEQYYESSSDNAVFLHDDGKYEIRIGVRQKIPLGTSSR
jgi:hypothetical protein